MIRNKIGLKVSLAVMTTAALAAALSGCSAASDTTASAAVKTCYSGYTLTNPYFAGMIKGLEDGAKEHGFDFVQTNSNGDPQVQASDIDSLVSQGCNYIIISPAQSDALIPSIEAAAKAGVVPIAISDTIPSDKIKFTVAMDHVTIGEQSAQGIVDFLTAKNGAPKGNIVEMQGIAGSPAGADRTKGFNNIISKYPDIKVVATADGGFDTDKTFAAFSTILQAHPEVEAVMTANDPEALGVMKALEAAGLQVPVGEAGHIFITGNDAPAPTIAAIRANQQDMTVSSNPIGIGKLVMDSIADLQAGKDVTGFVEWKGLIITPSNIDSDEVKAYGIWADQVG